jgi:hypothetical protein
MSADIFCLNNKIFHAWRNCNNNFKHSLRGCNIVGISNPDSDKAENIFNTGMSLTKEIHV